MASTPTTGLARMRRVPRRSTDSTEASPTDKTPASTATPVPPSVPQIVQASVRSIPQTDFIHTSAVTAVTALPGPDPGSNLSMSAGGRLTILAMNKELSIRPVEPPSTVPSSSDNDVQFVRCAKAVSTQTPETSKRQHSLEENGDQTPLKRAKASALVDYGSHPDLLKRIVQIKEERLVIEKEKLKTLRQLVSCLRGANGSSSVLAAVLGEKEPPK